jgi:cytochrome c
MGLTSKLFCRLRITEPLTRLLLLFVGGAGSLLACSGSQEAMSPRPQGATPAPTATGAVRPAKGCDDPAKEIKLMGKSCGPVAPPQLSCYLPSDVQGDLKQPDLSVRQRAADVFSWQEMLSLSWPAKQGERGVPEAAAPLQAPGPRVWETWKEEYEVFLPDGKPPGPWNDTQPVPGGCEAGAKVLTRTMKIADLLDSANQAAGATATLPPTLTDQTGHVVHYEIRLNEVLFRYIVDNKLYDSRIQNTASRVSIPDGALLVKASWREISTGEDSRFFTSKACICKQDPTTKQPVDCKRGATVGLTGLHIVQKTPSAPAWVWSTFEQVNNVSDAGGHPASFFNPACKDCRPDQQTKEGTPTQVTRVTPIPGADPSCGVPGQPIDNLRALDRDVQAALAPTHSPLAHYELVGTQWPLAGDSASAFIPSQVYLANTTMETFVQDTSTCIGCHSTARTVNPGTFVSSDFSFTLNNAQPPRKDDTYIPWAGRPVSAWDQRHWDEIRRGHDLTIYTYELAPNNVRAKLHCQSCHLNAGTDVTAAWWVNMGPMPKEIPSSLTPAYPTQEKLEARINSCFEHSMNGKALCTPASPSSSGTCKGDRDMDALIAYMQWVTEQWFAANRGRTPPRGYPTIPGDSGDYARGKALFAERCAVCHGANGQGRYEGGMYYRPALWGDASFNTCAGMGDPSKSSGFVHANMPLGAGGLLTAQDSWDAATFLDCQKRPVGTENGAPCKAGCAPPCELPCPPP